jgi:hypothetical protein
VEAIFAAMLIKLQPPFIVFIEVLFAPLNGLHSLTFAMEESTFACIRALVSTGKVHLELRIPPKYSSPQMIIFQP